jgi:Calpain family cysteine protease
VKSKKQNCSKWIHRRNFTLCVAVCCQKNRFLAIPISFHRKTFLATIFDQNVQWLRPHEICKDSRFQKESKSELITPQFVVEGFSRFDVQQGELGDCWFLAALAALAENKTLLQKVVPIDNGFDAENYSGIFQFR